MSHGPHESLPGWNPGQVLADGCRECESRTIAGAIGRMDSETFARAWERATEAERDGLAGVSGAELPLLAALWAVAVQLSRRGVPLGECPSAVSA